MTQMISKTEDDYVCTATNNLDEARQLIEAGFKFVTDMNNCKLFKKRKQGCLSMPMGS